MAAQADPVDPLVVLEMIAAQLESAPVPVSV
jgi:hypothetical protein